MSVADIYYSKKYQDDFYEYRFVKLYVQYFGKSCLSAVCNVAFMAMFNLKKITYSWYYVLVKLRLLCMLNFVLQTRNFAKRTRETSAKDANVRKRMAVDRRSTVTWLGTLYDSYPRYKKKYFLRNVLLKKL